MIIDQVDGHYDEVDGDAVDDGNDEEVDDDDDDLPVKLVVDSDGVDIEHRTRRKNWRSSRPAYGHGGDYDDTFDEHAHLQQLEGGGGVVGVFQVELGPRVVEDGKEGEVASVAPVKGR